MRYASLCKFSIRAYVCCCYISHHVQDYIERLDILKLLIDDSYEIFIKPKKKQALTTWKQLENNLDLDICRKIRT